MKRIPLIVEELFRPWISISTGMLPKFLNHAGLLSCLYWPLQHSIGLQEINFFGLHERAKDFEIRSSGFVIPNIQPQYRLLLAIGTLFGALDFVYARFSILFWIFSLWEEFKRFQFSKGAETKSNPIKSHHPCPTNFNPQHNTQVVLHQATIEKLFSLLTSTALTFNRFRELLQLAI